MPLPTRCIYFVRVIFLFGYSNISNVHRRYSPTLSYKEHEFSPTLLTTGRPVISVFFVQSLPRWCLVKWHVVSQQSPFRLGVCPFNAGSLLLFASSWGRSRPFFLRISRICTIPRLCDSSISAMKYYFLCMFALDSFAALPLLISLSLFLFSYFIPL